MKDGENLLPMIPSLPSKTTKRSRTAAMAIGGGVNNNDTAAGKDCNSSTSIDHTKPTMMKQSTMITINEAVDIDSDNYNDDLKIPPLPILTKTTLSSSSTTTTAAAGGNSNKENNDNGIIPSMDTISSSSRLQKFKRNHHHSSTTTTVTGSTTTRKNSIQSKFATSSPSMKNNKRNPLPPSIEKSTNRTISSSTPPNTIQRKLSRVLRSNESMEDLFCLDILLQVIKTSSSLDVKVKELERIKSICYDIVHGGIDSSNDIKKWKEVLFYVTRYYIDYDDKNANHSSLLSSLGSNLVRLHKRATSRFGTNIHPSSKTTNNHESKTNDQEVVQDETKNNDYEKDLVMIWLQYAKVQYKYNKSKHSIDYSSNKNPHKREDTLSIFKLLQNTNLGQQMSEYYISMAEFELEEIKTEEEGGGGNDSTKKKKKLDVINYAMNIIEDGIKNGARPIELLNIHLEKLQKQKIKMINNNDGSSNDREMKDDTNDDDHEHQKRKNLIATLQKRHNLMTVTSEKEGIIGTSSTVASVSASSPFVSNYLDRPKKRKVTSLRTKIKRGNNANTPSVDKKSKMGGPPKRIAAIDDDEDDEGDSDVEQNKSDDSLEQEYLTNKRPKVSFLEKKPEKITRASIGYLLNWNPSRIQEQRQDTKLADTSNDKEQGSNIDQFRKGFQPSMEKIDESAKEHQSTETNSQNTNSMGTGSSNQNTNSTGTGTNSQNTNSTGVRDLTSISSHHQTTENSTAGKKDGSQKQTENGKVDESLNEIPKQILSGNNIAVVNEFLPMISQKKVVKVNNVNYVKLAVIGKGGSCKVYRGLTKDGQNVAIKKVNLAGIQKKAIIGYANEIKLLKRLSGNPAIIQLYDSEVNLEKKAIFLVMEIGEVDLNHVLKEQAINNNSKNRSVNMNFIRLTWQQMLSAVHCIHEERIIHGDLKPANFLFVKGVLKLIDFGIAKAIQCDNTTNIYRDSQVGTLNYMSPESIQGTGGGQKLKCGRASDVWSLGCILYQMCYGKTPFADIHNMISKLHAIIDPSHEIRFPETIPSSAIDAIKACLERKPEDRSPIVGKNGLLNEHRFLNYSG